MKKRMLAAFLSIALLLSMSVFIPAYAAETDPPTESAEPTPAAAESAPTAEPTVTPELTPSPEPTVTPEPSATPEITGCAECGYTEGHAESCSQYKAPDPVGCTECGKADGHEETCSQYVAPAGEACPECGQTGGHLETCSQYTPPAPDVSGMTAEEIFAQWDCYSEDEKAQILADLAQNTPETYAALLALIDGAQEEETISLTVSAAIADGQNPDQDFIFTITNDSGFSMKIVLTAESFVYGSASVTVSGLPVGSYTVTADSWSWRYTADSSTAVMDANNSVSFAYTRNNVKWFDADFCRNIYYVPAVSLHDENE